METCDSGVTVCNTTVIDLSRKSHDTAKIQNKEVLDLLASRGQLAFDGEGVTQLPNDMGHWAMGLPGSPTLRGVDDADELTGER